MMKELSSYIVVWQTDVFCDYLSDSGSYSSSGSETDSIKASKPTSREVYLTVEQITLWSLCVGLDIALISLSKIFKFTLSKINMDYLQS